MKLVKNLYDVTIQIRKEQLFDITVIAIKSIKIYITSKGIGLKIYRFMISIEKYKS